MGDKVLKTKGKVQSEAEELQQRLAAREAAGDELGQRLRERRADLKAAQETRKFICRVVLEFGNTAKAGKKTSYTTFLKVPLFEGGPDKDPKGPVEKVDFNINPGYSKPTS